MRENRPYGSEGGVGESPSRPLSRRGGMVGFAGNAHGMQFVVIVAALTQRSQSLDT